MGSTAEMIDYLRWRGVKSERVLGAMGKVDRAEFVEEDKWGAYRNRPVEIGHDQTMSQPLMVALMLAHLEPVFGGERALDIGTGRGYLAAVLALLFKEVFTVERLESLAAAAAENFSRLELGNVKVRVGNGRDGWKEYAPYCAVVVSAEAEKIPKSLIEQLDEGGRIVMPVVEPGKDKTYLHIGERGGKMTWKKGEECAFVPLV